MPATDKHGLVAKLEDRLRHAVQYQRAAELALELLAAVKAVDSTTREVKRDGEPAS